MSYPRALFCLVLWVAAAGTVLADPVGPHIGIQSPASIPSLTNTPLVLHLNFTSAVNDFSTASVVTTNATVSNFSGSGTDYFLTIQPVADGPVTFTIPTNTLHSTSDGTGNVELALTTFTYDATPPSLELSSTSTGPTGEPIAVVAQFSEPVRGFGSPQVIVTNGSVGNFVASTSTLYTFTVTPTTDGTTTIGVGAGAAHDAAGNQSLAAAPLEFLFSNSPLAALSFFDSNGNALSSVAPGGSVVVRAVFSEPVADTPATTVAVSGIDTVATTSMAKVDSTHYTYSYTAGATGGSDVVVVDGALDLAGNPQIPASSTLSIVPPPAPSSGGGGGGSFVPSTSIVPPLPVSATQSPGAEVGSPSPAGEVLGASTYHFVSYLTLGSHGDAVLNLQKILISGGFLSATSTGYFGPLTKAALIAYQKANGIAQTGTTGPLTRAALSKGAPGSVLGASTYNFGTDLTLGVIGADVAELQKILIAQKFLHISAPTGYYGLVTAVAVGVYQSKHHIAETGIVDAATRGLLNAGSLP